MSTLFSSFLLVTDLDAPQYGAAYYFQQQYNKLALVPDDAIDVVNGKLKRDFMNVPAGYRSRKQFAAPEDRPWLCYWNNTFVEGFIYPQERADQWATPISSSLPPTTSSYPSSSSTSSGWPTGSYTTPWAIASAYADDTVTTTVMMPTTSCVYTGRASNFPDWMESRYPGWWESKGTAYPPPMTYPPGAKPTNRKRSDHYDNNGPAPYPYRVKIEERRLPGSPHPYCNKIQILDDLNWNFVPDTGEEPVTIQLTEQDPDYQAYVAGDKKKVRKRRLVPGECHCQWQSGDKQ